ncbi:MAG: type II secretion system F family protein [Candidatus Wallbacteria bacterium]
MSSLIIMGLIFLILVALFFVLISSYQIVAKRQESVKDRLDKFVTAQNSNVIQGPVLVEATGEAVKKSDFLQNIGSIITPEKIKERIALKLSAADIPLRANEFMAFVFFFATIPMIVICLFLQRIMLGLIMSVIAAYLPFLWIAIKRAKKKQMFGDQLLDTLGLISNSLKAGYSFLQAIELITREAPAPMSTEFKKVVRENSLGVALEDSLQNMSERMENDDFDLLVTVVLIQREVGGNLSDVLDQIADTIRERIKIKGQITTLTAQARMGGYVITGLPFLLGFAIYVMNPDYFVNKFLFGTAGEGGWFKGWYTLIGCGVMMGVGALIIKKITNIDV